MDLTVSNLRNHPLKFKKNNSLNDSDPLVAIVGVIARWKGQREFIEAAKIVIDQIPNAHFLIVGNEIYDTTGEKGELNQLKLKVQEYAINDSFTFVDFQKDLIPIYSEIDVLVHASIQPEPFGRVIVEAMLCECAVTASDQGGPLEIIQPGENGLLHDSSAPAEIAKNIISLLKSPQLRNQMGENASKAAQTFSMKNYCDQLSKALLA